MATAATHPLLPRFASSPTTATLAADAFRAAGFELRYLDVGDAGVVERQGALNACWNTRFEDVPPVRCFPSYQGQRS